MKSNQCYGLDKHSSGWQWRELLKLDIMRVLVSQIHCPNTTVVIQVLGAALCMQWQSNLNSPSLRIYSSKILQSVIWNLNKKQYYMLYWPVQISISLAAMSYIWLCMHCTNTSTMCISNKTWPQVQQWWACILTEISAVFHIKYTS